MPEPQLSVRSQKARTIAHELSKRTGRPINDIVEEALSDFKRKIGANQKRSAWARVWQTADQIAATIDQNATCDHNDLYDQDGLPI